MTASRLGKVQKAILPRLAASPEGLTTTDLLDLGRRNAVGNALLSLRRRNLARVTGTRDPGSETGQGARLQVWCITPAGRRAIREVS